MHPRDFQRAVGQAMKPLHDRMMNAFSRVILENIDDAQKRQIVQASILHGELKDGIERMQQYGFSSVPLPGCEALAICIGGNKDHTVVIAAEHREHRKNEGEPGDVFVYHYLGGYIHFKANKDIVIHSEETVRIEGKRIEIHAEEVFKHDAGGHGINWQETHKDTYSGTSDEHGLHPPEIP